MKCSLVWLACLMSMLPCCSSTWVTHGHIDAFHKVWLPSWSNWQHHGLLYSVIFILILLRIFLGCVPGKYTLTSPHMCRRR